MHYDRFTRLLHLLIAAGITVQMAVSLVMVHPKPGRPGDDFFEVHETMGAVLLGLLVLHWLWSLTRSGSDGFGRLFPWFSGARLAALGRDIGLYREELGRLRLPAGDGPSPLAGAIEGLGLLLGTALAATGTLILIYSVEGQRMVGWLHDVKEVHEALGPLMWGYLGLHVAAAMAHQVMGHGTLAAMARVWRRNPTA